MVKVFSKEDNPNPVMYSESYVVRFRIQREDKFWEVIERRYFTASKGKHKDVKKHWKVLFPKGELISITYE